MSTNVMVRRIVERRAIDESDAQMLLDALGLINEDGSTPPDDTKEYHFVEPSRGPGARNPKDPDNPTRPEGMTTPPGLANLPPVAPKPPKAAPKKRYKPVTEDKRYQPIPECGSYRAYARHRRLGVQPKDMDEACQQAGRDYSADLKAKHRRIKELVNQGKTPEEAKAIVWGQQ